MCKAVEEYALENFAEGKEEGVLTTLIGLVRDGILSIKDAALRANMSESAFKDVMERLSGAM